MRRFIYLDTDTLNSYLAQIFDGLLQGETHEHTVKTSDEKEVTIGGEGNGKADFILFGKGLEGSVKAAYENLQKNVDEDTFRDVQTKMMHDNAFDHFATYLKTNNLTNKNEIGSFISIEDDFYIFDIAFYQRLFEENGFFNLLEKLQAESVKEKNESLYKGLNRDQRRNRDTQKKIDAKIEEETATLHNGFESIKMIVDMLAAFLPYPQIMCISNYLVILNEKYLRDDLSKASFKYGGRIKLVGYITNKAVQDNKAMSKFAQVNTSINSTMKMFFDNIDEMHIVHPIAIFYEND